MFYFVFIFAFLPFSFSAFSSQLEKPSNLIQETPERKIANYLKSCVNDISDADVLAAMQKHFFNLDLMNENGFWKGPKLESISSKLLPTNASVQSLRALIDESTFNIEQNPYMHKFLLEAEKSDLSEFHQKIESNKSFIPDVLTYAMALENFTKASIEDVNLFEEAFNVWDSEGLLRKSPKYGLLGIIKYYSVRQAASDIIKVIKKGTVSQDFVRYLLPINILEAAMYECWNGNLDNYKVGRTLAENPPGGKYNPRTGSGPARISEIGQLIELHCPFPKEWADLYQAWNLAFVLTLNMPISIPKLLIPTVSGYQQAPQHYMHKRVIALYTSYNYKLEKTDIKSAQLNKIFGKVNAQSTLHYLSLFKRIVR